MEKKTLRTCVLFILLFFLLYLFIFCYLIRVRSMEQGALKIRVRSLENERALERMALTQASTSALLVASVLLQLGLSPAVGRVPSLLAYGGAALSAAKALGATAKTAAFDKKALKFETKDFGENSK